ncbi:hypothetical protein [Pedosphaera parvula]|uniref:Uncharacterized protein n=1 Tax=Pedosphaera parvula (strain Ellin514) TaxID=320771 RepID=B9XKP1_PEDPL|nr:hypothetical protein [Pedosphaera parvula]EEF59534.1 hypothetical protein Cflav_PD2441 [Pedosphaera parvula Ellin514]
MSAWLDIIIPVAHPEACLGETIGSLVAQRERGFVVQLNESALAPVSIEVNEAERQLQAAGIPVRRVKAPFQLKRTEQWNWAHSQSEAEWLKMLLPGEELKPAYFERLKQRVTERPKAQFVRCDAEVATDWGKETMRAPTGQSSISPLDFLNYFPRQMSWISRSINVAYTRTAWLATGGFSAHLPACAALNLNAILALHYGLENISESLVATGETAKSPARAVMSTRMNRMIETWLMLRQMKNYCLAAKLPWSKTGVASGLCGSFFNGQGMLAGE